MHHQTLHVSSGFPPPHRKSFDRHVSKIPQRALHKRHKHQKKILFNKFITTIRLSVNFLVNSKKIKYLRK